MNLDILGDETEKKVNTEKSSTEKVNTENIVVDYDKTKGNIEQPYFQSTRDKPYVKRAGDYAKSFGYEIEGTLKRALELRADKKNVLTIHEADIAYRGSIDLNNAMIKKTLNTMLGFLCEESGDFKEGIFVLRARWNKGIDWKKNKRHLATVAACNTGDQMLLEIKNDLKKHSLPLHIEEESEGFDREFLKPEYLTWEQFNSILISNRK
jgi:hypothetical protein